MAKTDGFGPGSTRVSRVGWGVPCEPSEPLSARRVRSEGRAGVPAARPIRKCGQECPRPPDPELHEGVRCRHRKGEAKGGQALLPAMRPEERAGVPAPRPIRKCGQECPRPWTKPDQAEARPPRRASFGGIGPTRMKSSPTGGWGSLNRKHDLRVSADAGRSRATKSRT